MQIKMNMEHWLNNKENEKQRYWERKLSQCHSVHHIRQHYLGSKPGVRIERPATNSHGTTE
jgi:hypothetical protein